jgi:signal transduction histidine kinase/CheY-like chemotaxis protein
MGGHGVSEAYHYLVVLPCLVTLISIATLFFEKNTFEPQHETKLNDALASDQFWAVYLVALAITVPMMMDVCTYFVHRDTFYLVERLLLSITCNVPLIVLYSFRHHHRADLIFSVVNGIQAVWIIWILFWGLRKSVSPVWQRWYVFLSFITLNFSRIFVFYEFKASVGLVFFYILTFMYVIAVVIFIYATTIYIRELWLNREEYSTREYVPLFCCVMVVCYSVTSVIPFAYWNIKFIAELPFSGLAYLVILNAFVVIVATLLPGRLARLEVREVEATLEVKKSFIRYIGHEIRTPLNVATLGLDLVVASFFPVPAADGEKGVAVTETDSNRKLDWSLSNVGICRSQKRCNSRSSCDAYSVTSDHEFQEMSNSFRAKLQTPSLKTREYEIPTIGNVQTHNVRHSTQSNGGSLPGTARLDFDAYNILNEVRKAVYFGTDILDSLLAYDKLDAKNMVLEKRSLDVLDLVTNSLNLFKMAAGQKKVKFVVNVEKGLPTFEGDEYKMRQVLSNLASNALKFTPPDGVVIVNVRKYKGTASQEDLMIQFIDSGVGIAAENIPKVFKKIIQFDANINQQGKGSGLGLYITRGLVELHGGTVSVESGGPGTGSTFIVLLPFSGSKRAATFSESVWEWQDYIFGLKWSPKLNMGSRQGLSPQKHFELYSRLFLKSTKVHDTTGELEEGKQLVYLPESHACVKAPRAIQKVSGNSSDGNSNSSSVRNFGVSEYGHIAGSCNSDGSSAPAANTVELSGHPKSSRIMPMVAVQTETRLFNTSHKKLSQVEDREASYGGGDSFSLSRKGGRLVGPSSLHPLMAMESFMSDANVDSDNHNSTITTTLSKSVSTTEPNVPKENRTRKISRDPVAVVEPQSRGRVQDPSAQQGVPSPSPPRSDGLQRTVTGSSAGSATDMLNSRTAASTGQWLAGFTVLLVDDSNSSIKMLSLLLRKVGCRCLTACDGAEAVEIIRVNCQAEAAKDVDVVLIDFVLMDNYMPVLCGPEACKHMRRLGYHNPIIGLTGHALVEDIAYFRAAGANNVLFKPLDISSLQRLLMSLIPKIAARLSS